MGVVSLSGTDTKPAVAPVSSANVLESPVVVSPSRELIARPSRERSPRLRESAVGMDKLVSLAMDEQGSAIAVDQIMLLSGLVQKSHLNGCRVKVLKFDVSTSRWSVEVERSDESICVKSESLSQCIFSQNLISKG